MDKKILGLRTVIYKVGDMEKAKEWYSRAFEKQAYFDEPFYIGFNVGGYELGLQPEETPAQSKPESVLTYWGVEDIEAVFTHFVERGARVHEAPHSVGDPLKVATVFDPWDNLIGFIYNPVFKADS